MSVAHGLGTRGGFPGSLGPRQGQFRGAEEGELAEDLSFGFLNCQTVRTVTGPREDVAFSSSPVGLGGSSCRSGCSGAP